MAKRRDFIGGVGAYGFLRDMDWIAIIGALLRDREPESKRLAKTLLLKTKQGRQIRLVQLMQTRAPRLVQIEKALRVSRRTLFRDMNDIERYGVRFVITEDFRYEIVRLPSAFKKVLSRVKL